MKHIKLFENFDSPLYWQVGRINQDERKGEELEERYFSDIKSRLKEGFSIGREYGWCRISKTRYVHAIRISYLVCKPGCKACVGLGDYHSPQTDFYVDIFQLDDEYFDLEYLDAINPDYQKYRFRGLIEYYRCDGIDGLIKFLEDEKIIK